MGPSRASPRVHVVLAISVGLLMQQLLFRELLGVNVALIVAATLVAGVLVAPSAPRRSDLWIPLAALVFAAFPAVRTETPLLLFDVPAALVLLLASAVALSGQPVTALPPVSLLSLGVAASGAAVTRGARVFAQWRPRVGPLRPALPVVRGVFIAAPFVAAFALLFSSADAVFARLVRDAVDLAGWFDALHDVPARAILLALGAYLTAGGLAIVRERIVAPIAAAPAAVRRGGITEAFVVFACVDALFVLFVALQVAYLFGGRDTLVASGYTYSAYARSGFFELITAAALAGTLVLGAEWLRIRSRVVVAAELLLLSLTGVVLVSAADRLSLYQAAYGWSELRVYAFFAIAWLAACLVCAAVLVARDAGARLPHAIVLCGLAVAGIANLAAPAELTARENVERVLHPELVPADGFRGIDASYLLSLGDAAVPDLVRALPALDVSTRTLVACALSRPSPAGGVASWSYERERARSAAVVVTSCPDQRP